MKKKKNFQTWWRNINNKELHRCGMIIIKNGERWAWGGCTGQLGEQTKGVQGKNFLKFSNSPTRCVLTSVMRYQPLDQIFGVRQRTDQTAVVKEMEESILDGPTAYLVFFFGRTLIFYTYIVVTLERCPPSTYDL